MSSSENDDCHCGRCVDCRWWQEKRLERQLERSAQSALVDEPAPDALAEAKSWLCEWERGAETKPEDVRWFARALETFARRRTDAALFEATSYSPFMSCCHSAKEHVAHMMFTALVARQSSAPR